MSVEHATQSMEMLHSWTSTVEVWWMTWVYPTLFVKDWAVRDDLRQLLWYTSSTVGTASSPISAIDLIIRLLMYTTEKKCTLDPMTSKPAQEQHELQAAIEHHSQSSAFCRWMADKRVPIAYIQLDDKLKELLKIDRMCNYFVEIELRKLRV